MSIDLKTIAVDPKRQTFGHVARRLGDKPASRYDEGMLDLQATHHFHYKPLWEPEYWVYDARKTDPLPPDMPFGALVSEVIKPHYAAHPDSEKVDWDAVVWMIDGEKANPDPAKSLKDNGIGHKSLVRFWTPGLSGYHGCQTA